MLSVNICDLTVWCYTRYTVGGSPLRPCSVMGETAGWGGGVCTSVLWCEARRSPEDGALREGLTEGRKEA